ncbi:hypothetical protein CJF30_00002065 [Rutstroemia sp. NJR-2017a BBW]|nr:hypothetical protein CJF30_00002065 [Rutstroemia sp. NJR-2017a BBW]
MASTSLWQYFGSNIDQRVRCYPLSFRERTLANTTVESLKQLLIMERTPEPEDTPTPEPAGEVDLNNLTAVQKERLQQFLRNEGIAVGIQTPDRKVKREKDDDGNGIRRKRSKKNDPPVIIDLLSDSEADK